MKKADETRLRNLTLKKASMALTRKEESTLAALASKKDEEANPTSGRAEEAGKDTER
jgi:hypothetical protein